MAFWEHLLQGLSQKTWVCFVAWPTVSSDEEGIHGGRSGPVQVRALTMEGSHQVEEGEGHRVTESEWEGEGSWGVVEVAEMMITLVKC